MQEIEGYIDLCSIRHISGWCWVPSSPRTRLAVELVAPDGRVLAQTLANRYREDLELAGKGDGKYAYSFRGHLAGAASLVFRGEGDHLLPLPSTCPPSEDGRNFFVIKESDPPPMDEQASYGCEMIQMNPLTFNGRVDLKEDTPICMCCEPVDVPKATLGETGRETMENVRSMHATALLEGQLAAGKRLGEKERIYTRGCLRCMRYKLRKWRHPDKITYVNLSMYPAPCDAKCIYCNAHTKVGNAFQDSAVTGGYEKVFAALEYAKNNGLLAPDAAYQVSSGEITIHPYKDRIMDIIGNSVAVFFTNCFRFDERIGRNLAANPTSAINLSIDSGTRETWQMVKGYDNFTKAIDNLERYRQCSLLDDQITFKYIMLPGINDSPRDFEGLAGLMKRLGVSTLNIARDFRYKYNMSHQHTQQLARAVGRMLCTLRKAGLSGFPAANAYSQAELASIQMYTDEPLDTQPAIRAHVLPNSNP